MYQIYIAILQMFLFKSTLQNIMKYMGVSGRLNLYIVTSKEILENRRSKNYKKI